MNPLFSFIGFHSESFFVNAQRKTSGTEHTQNQRAKNETQHNTAPVVKTPPPPPHPPPTSAQSITDV